MTRPPPPRGGDLGSFRRDCPWPFDGRAPAPCARLHGQATLFAQKMKRSGFRPGRSLDVQQQAGDGLLHHDLDAAVLRLPHTIGGLPPRAASPPAQHNFWGGPPPPPPPP